jgi:hypothetical protein
MTHLDMMVGSHASHALPVIRKIRVVDLKDALAKGIEDFCAIPTHAIFLCIIYPVAARWRALRLCTRNARHDAIADNGGRRPVSRLCVHRWRRLYRGHPRGRLGRTRSDEVRDGTRNGRPNRHRLVRLACTSVRNCEHGHVPRRSGAFLVSGTETFPFRTRILMGIRVPDATIAAKRRILARPEG